MKLQKIIFAFIILFISFQIHFGQERKSDLYLFDSVTEPNCEYLLNRLDSQAVEIQNNPESVGYIVIFGGSNPVENQFIERFVRSHFVMKKQDKNRFITLTTKGDEKTKIEFWISKRGGKPLINEIKFDYILENISKPVLFVQDAVEIADNDGKLIFFGDCAACCLRTINIYVLSEFLKVNPKINAQITIKNKSKKGADKLAKLILDEAEKEFQIESNRLKIKYGGKGQWNVSDEYLNKLSDVEIWLVPQKQK